MKRKLNRRTEKMGSKMLANQRGGKRWQKIVSVLGCVVVFCTTYALILPAITMEKDTHCGIEVHQHEDACYERELICQQEESAAHTHTDECYAFRYELTCEQKEAEPHKHSDDCYGYARHLACGLREVHPHTHTDACFTISQGFTCGQEEWPAHTHEHDCYTLVNSYGCGMAESQGHHHGTECFTTQTVNLCGLEESAEHTHTDACYSQEQVNLCGLAEGEGHTHSEQCIDTVPELTCTLREGEGHTHTDSCGAPAGASVLACGEEETEPGILEHTHVDACYTLDETRSLICGIEEGELEKSGHVHTDECREKILLCEILEHEHTAACYSDPTADIDPTEWIAKLPVRTGKIDKDLVAVALSQLGYVESGENYMIVGEEAKGYTIYGALYDNPYSDWSVMFVGWCLDRARSVDVPVNGAGGWLPVDIGCEQYLSSLQMRDCYREVRGEYDPKVGDLVFFSTEEYSLRPDHVGILVQRYQSGDTLTGFQLVSGDLGNAVAVRDYSVHDLNVYGYGILQKDEAPAEEQTPAEQDDYRASWPVVGYMEDLSVDFQPAMQTDFAIQPMMAGLPGMPEPGQLDIGSVTQAVMSWKPADQDPTVNSGWTVINSDTTLQGNEHIKLQVFFGGVFPAQIQGNDYKMHFTLPEGLERCETTGTIVMGTRIVGTLSSEADHKHVTLTLDPAWVDSLDPSLPQEGQFFITAELDAGSLDGSTTPNIHVGNLDLGLPVVTENLLARYGELHLTKSIPGEVFQDPDDGKYYLTYTLVAEAGEHGAREVVVRDAFNDTTSITGYNGVSAAEVIADGYGIAVPKDERISGSAAATGAQLPGKVSLKTLPTPDDPSVTQEYMVWNIGEMGPYEKRQLTYTVALSDAYTSTYHDSSDTLDNTAQIFSKNLPREKDYAHFTAKSDMTLLKDVVSTVENPDGTRTITYKLTVTAVSDNDFTLKNVTIDDSFLHTAYNLDEWVRYDEDSFLVDHQDGTAPAAPVTAPTFTNNGKGTDRGDSRASFTGLPIGDLEPGKTKIVTYTATLAQEAFTLGNGTVHVSNTAEVYDSSNPRKLAATKEGNVDITGIQWSRKSVGDVLTANRVENMNGDDFNLKRGTLKYEVIINESGEWNMNETTIVDAAVDNMLKVVGHVRVDAYLVNDSNRPADGSNDAAALAALTSGSPAHTAWITGVDGQTSFTQNINDLGFPAPPEGYAGYAYVLTYYAEADPSKLGSATDAMIPVGNNLSLTGTVGNGNGTFFNINTSVRSTKTISNPNQFGVKKTAWYYEAPGEGISGYTNGAFYWVVRVDGNELKEGLIIQDSSNLFKNGSYKNYNHDGRDGSQPSFVGAYVGSLGSDANDNLYELRDVYGNAAHLVSSVTDTIGDGKLRMVDYEVVGGQGQGSSSPIEVYYGGNITNDAGSPPVNNGGGVVIDGQTVYNHDINVRFRSDYAITPGESLFIVFRTEPMVLPQKGSDVYTFYNKVNYYNRGWTDLKNQAPSMTLYGSDSIQKSVTYPKLYFVTTNNGSTLRQPGSWNSFQGKQGPYALDYELVRQYLNSRPEDRGFFTGWNIRLNAEGKLSGTYRVKEILPPGMELAYLRLAGRGADTSAFTFNEITDLGPEWQRITFAPTTKTGQSGNGNNGSITPNEITPVICYRNGNEILFEISSFTPGNFTAPWVDFQVITHVTDTRATSGEAMDFVNTVQLLSTNGTVINTTNADVELALSDMITKDIATSKEGDAFNSSVLPFRIQINDYLDKNISPADITIPDLNPSGTMVNLIDEMSNALIIDPDSVRIYYGKFATDPWTNKNQPDPQLSNRVPKFDASSTAEYKGYTVVITNDAHTMQINNLPDNKIMTMFYNATVNVAPGQDISISNTAHWEGVTTPNADSNVSEIFKYTSAGSMRGAATLSIRKVDPADAQGSMLGGAKFKLTPVLYFDDTANRFVDPASSPEFQGRYIRSLEGFEGVTQDAQLLVFGTHAEPTAPDDTTPYPPRVVYNTVYRLDETEAPDGYVGSTEPYYFLIAYSDKMDASSNVAYPPYLEYLRSTSLADKDVYVSYSGGDYTYTAYNSRGRVEITKGFGGNVQSGRPVAGTYYFALYDLASNGMPLGDARYTSVITYTEGDLAAYDYAVSQGESYSYKTATFLDLPLNVPYYLFETDAAGNAIPEGGVLTSNGNTFVVNYTFPEGSTNHQVIPTKENFGTVHVIGTNNRYEASVTKSFADVVGNTLSQGLVGTYSFGIWKAGADGSFNLTTEPLDTKSIVFRIQDSNVSEKSVTFTGLTPGSYAIYELDSNGSPVLNGAHFTHSSSGNVANDFIVRYGNGNEFTIAPGTTEKQEITAVNNSSVSLPMTGGTGTHLYRLGGVLLMSISLLCAYCVERSKRKEAFQ